MKHRRRRLQRQRRKSKRYAYVIALAWMVEDRLSRMLNPHRFYAGVDY